MNIRIKYTKTGPLRFISHLDLMRYFQKAINRAGLDISYTTGMSPHQIISFAAPMPLMMTSEGEYLDAGFNSVTTAREMIDAFNKVASPFARISDMVILPDNAINSMAAVTASDYRITFTENGDHPLNSSDIRYIREAAHNITKEQEINVLKKTKKSKNVVNIKPLIHNLTITDDGNIYMLLATGSKNNLKPELVMEAVFKYADIKYSRFKYDIHRLETYMTNEKGEFVSLLSAGKTF